MVGVSVLGRGVWSSCCPACCCHVSKLEQGLPCSSSLVMRSGPKLGTLSEVAGAVVGAGEGSPA